MECEKQNGWQRPQWTLYAINCGSNWAASEILRFERDRGKLCSIHVIIFIVGSKKKLSKFSILSWYWKHWILFSCNTNNSDTISSRDFIIKNSLLTLYLVYWIVLQRFVEKQKNPAMVFLIHTIVLLRRICKKIQTESYFLYLPNKNKYNTLCQDLTRNVFIDNVFRFVAYFLISLKLMQFTLGNLKNFNPYWYSSYIISLTDIS